MADADVSKLQRDHTDESLRAERAEVDIALGQKLDAINVKADLVISRARVRADELLLAAREKSDGRRSTTPTVEAQELLARSRGREDQIVRTERTIADDALRIERDEQKDALSDGRDQTNDGLQSERLNSDQALATRDEFLGVVSHDLRNLVNAVRGFGELITDAAPEIPRHRIGEYSRLIEATAARMDCLIGDLLDVSSIQAGRLKVACEEADAMLVALEAVDTFRPQADEHHISISLEGNSTVPANLDPARMLQVLANLLSNAMKFTPARGKVVVKVERIGDEVMFSVTDTGIGIAARNLETIFGRYIQLSNSKTRSVGLGLYISGCIVKAHGGRIWAESQQGVGSKFTIALPAAGEA